MLRELRARLTEPHPSVRTEGRRQARQLASFLVVLMPLGAASATAQLVFTPGFLPTFVAIAIALCVLCLAYALSRSRRYRMGAVLAIATISLACLGSVTFNPSDAAAPAFLLLGILVATALLGMRATAIVAASDVAGLLVVHALRPGLDTSRVLGMTMFLAIASSLILVGAWHRDRLARDGERALCKSEARCGMLLGATFDGIVLTRDGRIVHINDGLARLLGVDARALERSELLELFAPDSRAAVRSALDAQSAEPLEASVCAVDGRRIPVEVATASSTDPREHALALRDLTAKRRIEAQLRLADRLSSLGVVTAAVAHELNNPLTYVMGSLDLAAREGTARAMGHLEHAREGVERMRVIAEGLRAFSRGDEDSLGPVDVETVIASTLRMAEAHLRDRCRVVCDLHAVPAALANPVRLGQVVMNLLLNAVQAIPDGVPTDHEIRITLRDAGKEIELAVSDTGRGIEKDVLPYIFDPFFTTKPVGVGTGLGLWVCHGIVRSCGGRTLVESEQGRGATFRVRLLRAREDGVET